MTTINSPLTREPVEPEARRAFSAEDISTCRAMQFDLCECGAELSDAPFEADHIIPLELGGETTLGNLQLLCLLCHKAKTRIDRTAIAKAARIRRRLAGDERPKRKIRSRGFPKDALR